MSKQQNKIKKFNVSKKAKKIDNKVKKITKKEIIYNIKTNGCVICKQHKKFVELEFHHLHSKYENISNLVHDRNISIHVLKSELAKCLCVCHNCHQLIHHGIITLNEKGEIIKPDFQTSKLSDESFKLAIKE